MGKLKHRSVCIVCQTDFLAKQTGTKYCSDACRQKRYRDSLRCSVQELRNDLCNVEQDLRNAVTKKEIIVAQVASNNKVMCEWCKKKPLPELQPGTFVYKYSIFCSQKCMDDCQNYWRNYWGTGGPGPGGKKGTVKAMRRNT